MELVKVNLKLPDGTKKILQDMAGGERHVSRFVSELIIRRFNLYRGAIGARRIMLEFEDALLTLAHERIITGDNYAKWMNMVKDIEKELSQRETADERLKQIEGYEKQKSDLLKK